jgi:hypothetical protein
MARTKPADVEDMRYEIDELHARLMTPGSDWNEKGEGGGVAGGSLVVQAFALAINKPVEWAKAFISDKLEKEKARAAGDPAYKPITRAAYYESLRRQAKVKEILVQLEAERDAKRAPTGISGDELLEEALAES